MNRTLTLGLALWACGCGDDAVTAEPPGVTAIYGDMAETPLTPYPSDRYLGDGHVMIPPSAPDLVNAPGLEETIAELEAMTGFSTTAGVIVMFDGPIDVRGIALEPEQLPEQAEPLRDARDYLEPGAPFYLVDVARGELVGLVPGYWAQAEDDFYTSSEYTIIAMPAEPLRPQARYLFAVTDALRAADGGRVHRSPDMEALLSGDGGYAAEVAEGLAALEAAAGVAPSRVSLATSFTTAPVHDTLLALADATRDGPAPALTEPWEIETPLAADGRVRFRARYQANEYRKPPPDSRFELGDDGLPVVQETVGLEVFLAISDAAADAPRPVVIYGHGLGGDKDGCWGTAERLADLNAAVFAIDSPFHGSRAPAGARSDLDGIFAFFGIDIDTQSFVIGRSRDNFRQMAIDQLELVRLIATLDTLDILPPGAPDGVPDLDTSRILYIGHSFGSVQGPTIFALAPEISHAVWNVGGAGLMMLLRDSGTFGLLVNSLKPQGTPDGAVARFMTITQAIVDPGDPLNYARYALREAPPGVPGWTPREVLLQEVVNDTIVPNSTTRALARATGLTLIDPIVPVSGLPTADGPVTANLPEGVTGALSQFDRINGDDVAVHGELIFSPEGRAQYLEFFRTALTDTHATIPSAY